MFVGRLVLKAARSTLRGAKIWVSSVNSFSAGDTMAVRVARSRTRTALLPNITAIGGLGAFMAGCITTANAGDGNDHNKPRSPTGVSSSANSTWASNRLQTDICHMAPGISEVLLDILDVLQENCDNYVNSMRKRVNDLETNLQKYGSTLSLNLSNEDAENVSLSDPGSLEIQQCRREYRSAYKQCNDMVTGLDKFLLSAHQFGAKTCITKCEQELDEVRGLLEDTELQISHYERKLAMAEKHFHSKRRRAAVGQNRIHSDIKERRG